MLDIFYFIGSQVTLLKEVIRRGYLVASVILSLLGDCATKVCTLLVGWLGRVVGWIGRTKLYHSYFL